MLEIGKVCCILEYPIDGFCFWDIDTYKMKQKCSPYVLELLSSAVIANHLALPVEQAHSLILLITSRQSLN